MFNSRQWIEEDGKKFLSKGLFFSTYYLPERRLPWTPVASLFASLVSIRFLNRTRAYQSVPVAREHTPRIPNPPLLPPIAFGAHTDFFIFSMARHCVLRNISFPGLSHDGKDCAATCFVRSDETAVSQMKNWTVIRHVSVSITRRTTDDK